MKYKRLIILIIVFTMTFNFIFIPKSQASIALTLGGLALTYEVAQAIYLTALSAAALGVTFLTWQEAKNFHDMIEGTSPAPLDYPEWEDAREQVQQSKAELANEHWFSQWGLEVLPGGQQDPDPSNNNKRGILAFLGSTGIIGGFINNYLSMFQKLEPIQGVNDLIIIPGVGVIDDMTYKLTSVFTGTEIVHTAIIRGVTVTSITPGVQGMRGLPKISYKGDNGANWTFHITGFEYLRSNIWNNGINQFAIRKSILDGVPNIDYENTNIRYKVYPDSPIFDGGSAGEIKYPQPNLIPIPRHNPSTTPIKNPDGTPKPGIHRILNPDGSIEERYYGDIDDLLRDIVMNIPIDEILNPDSRPYEIVPGGDHIKITYPDADPTVPYPQPKPPTRPEIWPPLTPDPVTWPDNVPYPEWPQPDPVTWPDPYPYPTRPDPWPPVEPIPWPDPDTWPPSVPYPYPDPDTWPPSVPYPYPKPEPNPNPSPIIPVEPGKQIDYTPWLQIIINWLSRIWNKIPEDKEQNQEVEPEVPGIDFSPLQDIDLTSKFPFSLPWDIKASIELLVDDPQAPRWEVPIVSETIVIDLDQFEQLALISRSFLSIIYIVMLVILTRRFIGGS